MQTSIIPVKSAIKLLESRKFQAEQFNDYVRHSCKEIELLKNENERLRQNNKKLEQECRQHLATNLRLLEQLNEVEERLNE